jgi:hypothetical protein
LLTPFTPYKPTVLLTAKVSLIATGMEEPKMTVPLAAGDVVRPVNVIKRSPPVFDMDLLYDVDALKGRDIKFVALVLVITIGTPKLTEPKVDSVFVVNSNIGRVQKLSLIEYV